MSRTGDNGAGSEVDAEVETDVDVGEPEGTEPVGDETDESIESDESDESDEDEDLAEAPPRLRLALVVAVLVALVAGGLVWVLGTSEPSTDRAAYSTLLDEAAPGVSGEDLLGGASFDLDEHRGQWVVVNFFATWCPPCRREHPELITFDETYGPEGTDEYTLVSVVFDESTSDAVSYFEDEGGDWPLLNDPGGQVSLDYGVLSVPETYLIDPTGVVRQKVIGGVTSDGLVQEIEALEADLLSTGELTPADVGPAVEEVGA